MRYRKRPVEIEAEQYRAGLEDGFVIEHDPTLFADITGRYIARDMLQLEQAEYATPFYSLANLQEIAIAEPEYLDELSPFIHTLVGRHLISPGDWIITDAGARYPCRPDIFELTYQAIE